MILLGADHGGFALKEAVKQHLLDAGWQVLDVGTHSDESCDYPIIARTLCSALSEGKGDIGLLFCGTGLGISIAANKQKGIRAVCCSDVFSARHARLHNDANILCLGGRVVGVGLALELVDVFLSTAFEGGRHARRVALIEQE